MRTCARILGVMLGLLSVPALAEYTISQTVAKIHYDPWSDHVWIIGPATWGATSCPSATYIRLPADIPGRKQLFAILLSAQASGRKVQFSGSCHTDTDYFNGGYVIVE